MTYLLEQEGVRKFILDWEHGSAPAPQAIEQLVDWRDILHARGLVGADPARYGGIGFGNLSRRTATGFLITGSQTGALPRLEAAHFCLVRGWDIPGNRLQATGPIAPSSEALTHAACYAANPAIHWVFHIHSPELWHAAPNLGLASTDPAIAYGTPAMAEALTALADHLPLPCLIRMGGHEDGLIAAGPTAEGTGAILLQRPAQVLA